MHFFDGCSAWLLLLYTYRGFSYNKRTKYLILEWIWRKYWGPVIKLGSTFSERWGKLELCNFVHQPSRYSIARQWVLFYFFMIYSQFFILYDIEKFKLWCSSFFWGLPMCKTKLSFSLLDSKKNWHKIWNFNSTRNSYEITSPPFLILLVSEQFFFSSCVLGLKGARPYQDQTNINATITRESEERAVSWR